MTRIINQCIFRVAVVLFIVPQIAGCSSSEERAQNYDEHGMKLLAQHDDQGAGEAVPASTS